MSNMNAKYIQHHLLFEHLQKKYFKSKVDNAPYLYFIVHKKKKKNQTILKVHYHKSEMS